MLGYDGTGPMGQGPMTGRGMGYCAPGAPQTDVEQPVFGVGGVGYGVGRGGLPRGGGRGRCFGGGRWLYRGLGRGIIRGIGRIGLAYTIAKQQEESKPTVQQESKFDKIIGLLEKILEKK